MGCVVLLPVVLDERDEKGIKGVDVPHQQRKLLLHSQLHLRHIGTPLCLHTLLLLQHGLRPLLQLPHQRQEVTGQESRLRPADHRLDETCQGGDIYSTVCCKILIT